MTIADSRAGLLAVIDEDRRRRRAEILDAAESEASARLAEARRTAWRRLRDGLRAERSAADAQLRAAQARLDAARRARLQAQSTLALAAARELLRPALQRRWDDPEGRSCWLEAALASAAVRLPKGGWRLRHPPALSAGEAACLAERARELGAVDAACVADASLVAGVAIEATDGCLDATADGLLNDAATVDGRLLWLIEGTCASARLLSETDAHPPERNTSRAEAASRARIEWISGPVLRARADGRFVLREALRVGPRGLLGEVVRLDGATLVAQVYEDSTGLAPGDPIEGSGAPLSIRLGPALLGGIFDGLLRPLAGQSSAFVESGLRSPPARRFAFVPGVAVGARLAPGAIFGSVGGGAAGGREQRCLVPPGSGGEVVAIAAAGEYADDETVCTLRDDAGREQALAMSHDWPVRAPRPVAARRPTAEPLFTGQRILDALFPLAKGGKAAIPGGFGTGKTVLLEALVKACAADVIVYLGCGERGNEMAGAVEEIAALIDARTGRPMRERTVIVANTSNMPVAAREASIYCAVTIAEYFRDQGLDVALMADSTSRWAEALREVSGRLGELPGEGGYPAYLGSRLAEFYERAAVVDTLAGGRGSVTLLGAVSPQAGDFSEPVTSHTTRYVRSFWALDAKRAHARFYPAIHPLQSYSEDAGTVEAWWREVFAGLPGAEAAAENPWPALRRRFLTLLDQQAKLERMARIVGKDALQPAQRLTLLCAEVVSEAFLRQSAFSVNDRYCGPRRQALMMRTLGRFLDLAEGALTRGASPEAVAALPLLRPLQRMGEEFGEADEAAFAELAAKLDEAFAGLAGETGDAA